MKRPRNWSASGTSWVVYFLTPEDREERCIHLECSDTVLRYACVSVCWSHVRLSFCFRLETLPFLDDSFTWEIGLTSCHLPNLTETHAMLKCPWLCEEAHGPTLLSAGLGPIHVLCSMRSVSIPTFILPISPCALVWTSDALRTMVWTRWTGTHPLCQPTEGRSRRTVNSRPAWAKY